jgi:hypothetical protein
MKYCLLIIISTMMSYANAWAQVTTILGVSKDALVWSYDPTGIGDRGTTAEDLVLSEWTKDGTPTTKYALLDFDFSAIPNNATIHNATLYLYHAPGLTDVEHSQLSGSNEGIVQRITSNWDETVYWNITPSATNVNETTIPASTSSTQNYILDVTTLTQDIVDDKENSYGFLMKIATPTHYRKLVFASNNYPNEQFRPKLHVTYTAKCQQIVLSSVDGKDAQVWSYDPTGIADRGTAREDLVLSEWTKDGISTTKYALLDFDFSAIPAHAIVQEAKLYLYHADGLTDVEHSQLSGSNEGIIQRITSSWDETVYWNITPSVTNTNATTIPASTSNTQNYILDVTTLTQDIVDDKDNSYGFLMKIATPAHYRKLVFASNNYPDAAFHPKLEVCYKVDPILSLDVIANSANSSTQDILLYPNPASDYINVVGRSVGGNVSIYDALGMPVKEVQNVSENERINVVDLPKGLYIVKVGDRSTKLVLE